MIPLKESPRWLMKKGRYDTALANLTYIRRETTPSLQTMEEYAEIKASVEAELLETDGVQVKEMWLPGNRKRVLLGFAVMVCQQLSGTIVFTYVGRPLSNQSRFTLTVQYAPQFFQEVGLKSSSTGLFATGRPGHSSRSARADLSGVYGIVKTVFSMIFLLWFIDRIGRRPSLIYGAGVMGAVMLINACLLATHPPQPNTDSVSSYSIVMIVMIYVYCIGYSWSWGPVPWTYVGYVSQQRPKEVLPANCPAKYIPTASASTAWPWRPARSGRSTTASARWYRLRCRISAGGRF